MVQLKSWQWVVLILPIASVVIFLLVAASWQIHQWGLSWIWALVILIFVGWRWLLVKWLRPEANQIEAAIAQVNAELIERQPLPSELPQGDRSQQAESVLQSILTTTRSDRPFWEDGGTFWQRCRELVVAIAQIYHPEVKYPLLNIYIPQAYGLIRGTVDDMDHWMAQLSPVLNQMTVAQAYQGYETYRRLEPSARKLWQVWNWAQWILNPAAALARQASQRYGDRANQELLFSFGQMFREVALTNLARQAANLYSGEALPPDRFNRSPAPLPKEKTQTLQAILDRAEPVTQIEQKPVNILLAGRTGAGKSSLINTLFQGDRAEVDLLPSTDRLQNHQWQATTGEQLNLWDTPGYEQIGRGELREEVLAFARKADVLILVTPALDPALELDRDFLQAIHEAVPDLPAIALVSQVDRLRPLREWEPPYDWQVGDRPKEISIRDAVTYRAQQLSDYCAVILPIVTQDRQRDRPSWNGDILAMTLLDRIDPAKQLRLARFLRDQEARALAAAKIIDRYSFQMTTTQGLTALLKSPILSFLSTFSTGSLALAYLLAEQIPIEQLPVTIGKLQMAYDLFNLLADDDDKELKFDLLDLWSLFLDNEGAPNRNAWALGHGLVEYWTQNLTIDQLKSRFAYYRQQPTESQSS